MTPWHQIKNAQMIIDDYSELKIINHSQEINAMKNARTQIDVNISLMLREKICAKSGKDFALDVKPAHFKLIVDSILM